MDSHEMVKIGADELRGIREELVKAAETERRNDVLEDVLKLVADGHIDAAVACEKVAEYIEDPRLLELQKLAAAGTVSGGTVKIGSAVDADKPIGSGTPEDQFLGRLDGLAANLPG